MRKCVLTMLFFTHIFALDKIIFEDGTQEIVKVLSQSRSEVTYRKDGERYTKAKLLIKTIEIDFDLDKYYRVGTKLTDPKKRLRYMELSVKNFPDKIYNKAALVRAYLLNGQVKKAEALYEKLSIGYLSFSQLSYYVENETTFNELRLFIKGKLSIEDYGKAKKLGLNTVTAYRDHLQKNPPIVKTPNPPPTKIIKPITPIKIDPATAIKGIKPLRIRLKAGAGLTLMSTTLGTPNIESLGETEHRTEISSDAISGIGLGNLEIQMDIGPIWLRYNLETYYDQKFQTKLLQKDYGNKEFNIDKRTYQTTTHEAIFGYNFLDRYKVFLGLRRIHIDRPVGFRSFDLKDLNHTLDAWGLGGGIHFEFKNRTKKIFNVYFPMGIAAYYDLPMAVTTSTMQSDDRDDYEINSFGFLAHLGVGLYLNLKQSYYIELITSIKSQTTRVSTDKDNALISPNNDIDLDTTIHVEEEFLSQTHAAIYLKMGTLIDFNRYIHRNKSLPKHLTRYDEWKKTKK